MAQNAPGSAASSSRRPPPPPRARRQRMRQSSCSCSSSATVSAPEIGIPAGSGRDAAGRVARRAGRVAFTTMVAGGALLFETPPARGGLVQNQASARRFKKNSREITSLRCGPRCAAWPRAVANASVARSDGIFHDGRVASHTCDFAASKRWICADLRDFPPHAGDSAIFLIRRRATADSALAPPSLLALRAALDEPPPPDQRRPGAPRSTRLEARRCALADHPSSPGDAATAEELMELASSRRCARARAPTASGTGTTPATAPTRARRARPPQGARRAAARGGALRHGAAL